MRRAIAVTVAVLVSIIWLTPPVAVGAAALGLWRPQDYIQDYLPDLILLAESAGVDVNQIGLSPDLFISPLPEGPTGEPDVVAIDTPIPEPPTETPTPEPPTETPTPEPPTETPTPTPTTDIRANILATIQASGRITATEEITATDTLTPSIETPGITQQVRVAAIANVRSGPGSDFDTVGTIDADATVSIVAQDPTGEWFLLDDGTWIAGEVLVERPSVPVVEPTPATAEGAATPTPAVAVTETTQVTVTVNSDANLRAGPGTTFDTTGGVTAGSSVVVVGRFDTDNWYLLSDGNWIFGALLSAAVADVPVVDAQGRIVSGENEGQSVLPGAESTTGRTRETPTPPPAAAFQLTVNTLANLRAGPGTNFDRVGSVDVGATITITGRNPEGDWLRLEDGTWVFASLVDNVPTDVPIVNP